MRIDRASVSALLLVGVLVGVLAPAVLLGGCAGSPPTFAWVELTPGLRVDVAQRVVEFDGEIAVDAHHEDSPTVWLELFVTGPDSREHESLVVTRVRPSLIHAAMLAAGFEPGEPGRVRVDRFGDVQRARATGEAVRVEFVLLEGSRETAHDPARWAGHVHTGEVLADHPAWRGFVFAGSREVQREGRAWYDADGTGVVVGLTTFGSEVIAPGLTLSPESGIDEAAWVALASEVPEQGEPVRVRVWGVLGD
ncbi:MAG: hypothetical protein ACI89L_000888 [Phycisphaerales bacterium]|jgi:hypothetical protein